MIKIWKIISKNFKLLIRSKISALIIFIGPLLLVTLLGVAFSQSSTFTLTAGVYSESYSNLSDTMVQKMENQNFRTIKYPSIDSCINAQKQGENQVCVEFPPDMEIVEGKTNQIEFYVDYSQINLVFVIVDVITARVGEQAEEITESLTEDILSRVDYATEQLTAGQTILGTIKANIEVVQAETSDSQTTLDNLDLSSDFSFINIGEARSSADNSVDTINSIQTKVNSLKSSLTSDLESINDELDSVKNSLEDNSSEADDVADVMGLVNEAIAYLNTTSNSIQSNVDDAANSTAGLKDLMDNIKQGVDEVSLRMGRASNARKDVVAKLDNVNAKLLEMTANSNELDNILAGVLNKFNTLQITSAQQITSPITTKINAIAAEKSHFHSLFPSLVVLIIMITGVLLGSTLTIVDKKSRAFFRNHLTPTSNFTFNLGTYLTALIMIIIQVALFLTVSSFFFDTNVVAGIGANILLLFLITSMFIFIGILVGFLFKTEETVTLAGITVGTILLLFSSVVIPLESMPAYIKSFALFNPFVIAEIALRQSVIFGLKLVEIKKNLFMLIAYTIGVFVFTLILQYLMKKLQSVHFNVKEKEIKYGKKGALKLDDDSKEKKKK